jgi:hypothetical protein
MFRAQVSFIRDWARLHFGPFANGPAQSRMGVLKHWKRNWMDLSALSSFLYRIVMNQIGLSTAHSCPLSLWPLQPIYKCFLSAS